MIGTGPATRPSVHRRLALILIPLWLAAAGCAPQIPGAPAAGPNGQEGCRVYGRIVSTDWRGLGGGIERAIVSAWREGVRLEEIYGQGERFEIRLPPGKYRLVCSA